MSLKHGCLLCWLLAAFTAGRAPAQDFDLSWKTVDGGGVMFTIGGRFELSGSIAQPDAGSFVQPLSSDVYVLVGGFWPVGGAPGCACPGDVDCDNDVDLTDLTALLGHFGVPGGAGRSDGDLDGDGDVDINDLAVLLAGFGSTC
ncbi:MAG: hypothetical protein IT450_02845 [Phycisphaerales bacterium]|nr:hypothetical protein [Phycisphaerales bacterium]